MQLSGRTEWALLWFSGTGHPMVLPTQLQVPWYRHPTQNAKKKPNPKGINSPVKVTALLLAASRVSRR